MSAKAKIDPVISRDFMISNKLGLHARPAALFVKTANRFDCEVLVEKDGQLINGKSIISLLVLSAGPGSRLTVQARGEDAPAAVAELGTLIERRFDEE